MSVEGIRTQGLCKEFGKKRVVNEVDLTVRPGEIVGLLGPNGAGKTTSFYMIVGLVRASQGMIALDETEITRLPMFRRARLGIGYLPQEPSVFRKLTVLQNLQAIAETLPLSRAEQKDRVAHQIKSLGLQSLRGQRAYTLSGGERRRVEIARALLTGPRFLLMDEPFSGVDPISVRDVQDIIVKLREEGIGILITDLNVRETLRIVDRAYLLHEGRVLSEGRSEELVKDPASRQFYLGSAFEL